MLISTSAPKLDAKAIQAMTPAAFRKYALALGSRKLAIEAGKIWNARKPDTNSPANLAKLKFKPKKLPALTAEQEADIQKKYSPYMTKKLLKVGTRLLSIKKGKKGQNMLMYWPWPFSKNNTKVKTPYLDVTRHDIYAAMAAGPDVTNPGTKDGFGYRGWAKCRVCGVEVGTADMKMPHDFLMPQGVRHYLKHGIKRNLVEKPVLDKDTGQWYTVRYIGTMTEM